MDCSIVLFSLVRLDIITESKPTNTIEDAISITGPDVKNTLNPPYLVGMPVVVTPSTGPYHMKSSELCINDSDMEIYLDIVEEMNLIIDCIEFPMGWRRKPSAEEREESTSE